MNTIAIVTDSTCDIPHQEAEKAGITIVPLSVIHGDKSYLDGVDLTPATFYPLLKSSSVLPTTSQPSPAQFQKAYEKVLESASEIVSIHISSELSATSSSARMAAEAVGDERIHVIDSGFVSYALGMQVLEAARLAKEGLSAPQIIDRLGRIRSKMELVFSLDTLQYLQKGGRIGLASAFLGTVLGIKPVLRIEGGHLVPAGKARGTKGALTSIVDLLVRRYGKERVTAAVGHAAAPENAAMLGDMILARLNVEGPVRTFEIGPVVGTHSGPGAAGIVVLPVDY
ncbi:MAG: DegV family protein [Bacillota bacterium]